MAGYSWLSLSTALTQFAQRLNTDFTSPNSFWTQPEAIFYLQQSLRQFNALTFQQKTNFTYNSPNLWNSLGLLSGSPRIRTLTDNYVITQIQYMLLDNPTGVGTWTGTNQFNLADVTQAVQTRRDEMLQVSNCNLSLLYLPLTPNTRRTLLPDTVIDVPRVRFMELSADTTGVAAAGSTSIILASTSGIKQGQIALAPEIPIGALVVSVSGNTVEISAPVTSDIVPFVNATGEAYFFLSRPLGQKFFGCRWEGFTLVSPLPSDAVIQGIYPVMVASATRDQAFSYYQYGPGLSLTNPVPGVSYAMPFDPSSLTFTSTEFVGDSQGTSLSVLTGMQQMILLNQSLFLDNMQDVAKVTACGFAIDYLSATPLIDPQIPPPFTVLPGHGLAWALPTTKTTTQGENSGWGNLQLTQSSLAGGIATFNWVLLDGSTPPIGTSLTTRGLTNGGSVLNGDNFIITAVTGTTSGTISASGFPGGTLSAAAENGVAGVDEQGIAHATIASAESNEIQFFQGTTLYRDDTVALEFYEAPLYQLAPGTPQTYQMSSEPPLSFDVDIVPDQPGMYECVVLQSGTPFAPPASTLLGIPDDYVWVLIWGALADLLGRESEATDRQRAAYCMKRYQDGLTLLLKTPWIMLGSVNGVACSTDSIFSTDRYMPEWDSSPGTFGPCIVTGGIDFLGTPINSGTGLTILGNMPVPSAGGDFLQVNRSDFDIILDLAQCLATFKMGGAEFEQALELEKRAIQACSAENSRLRSFGAFSDILVQRGQAQERDLNRYNSKNTKGQ